MLAKTSIEVHLMHEFIPPGPFLEFQQRTCPIHFFRSKTHVLGCFTQFRCRTGQITKTGYCLHTRLSHYSETFNQAIHTMSFVKRAIAKTSVGCIQGTSLCLRNCFLFFLQRTRPIHYCRSKTHVSGSFRLQNRLLFSSNDTSFHNGSGTSTKWPETRVLDVKYVVRNQVDVLEHRNGVKIPKI